MGAGPRPGGRAAVGGIAEADEYAGIIRRAVNAARMGASGLWRPLVGLTTEDEGGLVERVLAAVVIDRAVEENNREVERANRG